MGYVDRECSVCVMMLIVSSFHASSLSPSFHPQPPWPIKSYLALPKGGLVPKHILILPIGHYPSTVGSPQVCMHSTVCGVSVYACTMYVHTYLLVHLCECIVDII